MNIIKINFFNNKQDNTNFGKYYNHRALNQLPKTPCANCGGRTITTAEIKKFWGKVTRPLSKLIAEGKMSYWKKKYPEVYDKLLLFACAHPKDSLDKILEDKKIESKTIKQFNSILEQKQLEEGIEEPLDPQSGRNLLLAILNTSRHFLRSAGAVMKHTKSIEDAINSSSIQLDKDVFKLLQIYAQKYPRKTFSEIFHLPDVYKHHKQKKYLLRAENYATHNYHFQNIANLVKKHDEEYFAEIQQQAKEILTKKLDDNVKRIELKELYYKALKQKGCLNLLDKVMKEIDGLPMTLANADSFLVYFADKKFNDGFLLNAVIENHTSTFEHLFASSKGGADNINNGVVLCQHCNETRGNGSYERLIKAYPKAPINFHRQMLHVIKNIEAGNLPKIFDSYPIKVLPVIKHHTAERVNLEIPVRDYSKRLARRKQKEFDKTQNKLEQLKVEETEENNRILELEKALKESKEKLVELKKDKAQTTIEHNTAHNVQLLAEGFVNKSKKKKV